MAKEDRVVLTDLQKLAGAQLASEEGVARLVAEGLAEQLGLEGSAERAWNPARSWNANFERFVRREVLGNVGEPVVWGLDGVDRLFAGGLGADLFALFRAWHNERALDPGCSWSRLTLAIPFATEPHLFITDLDHSPFNVGTRLDLEDFTAEQVAELNRRWGAPLSAEGVRELMALVGGHPYLAQRALHEAAGRGGGVAALAARAQHDDGPFADHLRRLLGSLARDPALQQALGEFLAHGTPPEAAAFYRLRSAGVLTGDTPASARPRCELYRAYLAPRLG